MSGMLGAFSDWAVGQLGDGPGRLSLRAGGRRDLGAWRATARERVRELLAEPAAAVRDVRVDRRASIGGLDIELLSWQLPWGPRTEACLLKPSGATGRLPGLLALHDHGGFKYLGWRKIVRSQLAPLHPLVERHQRLYYGDVGWPDEIARRGYAVLCHDVFTFGSRRIRASDLPDLVVERMTGGAARELSPGDRTAEGAGAAWEVPEEASSERIERYHAFAAQHESIVAKSLFSAGLTWPGIVLAEDRAALAYLAARDDVDPGRLACCGLSGGGLRTCFLAGMDDRIRVAVTVGFLTTWRDFARDTSHTHTWMIYVPGLPATWTSPRSTACGHRTRHSRSPPPRTPCSRAPRRSARAACSPMSIRPPAPRTRSAFPGIPGGHQFEGPMQAEAFDWIGRWLG